MCTWMEAIASKPSTMIGINVLVSTRNEDAVDIKRKKKVEGEKRKKRGREKGRKERI